MTSKRNCDWELQGYMILWNKMYVYLYSVALSLFYNKLSHGLGLGLHKNIGKTCGIRRWQRVT